MQEIDEWAEENLHEMMNEFNRLKKMLLAQNFWF